jgi:hypothetical protein
VHIALAVRPASDTGQLADTIRTLSGPVWDAAHGVAGHPAERLVASELLHLSNPDGLDEPVTVHARECHV